MKCPCKTCDHREAYCHGKCDLYKEWSEKRHEINRKKAMDQENRQLSRDHERKYRRNLKGGWR